MQGAWLALGPFRLSKPGMAPLLAHLFGGNGTLWKVRRIEISTRDRHGTLISIPFQVSAPFWVAKMHQSVNIRKTISNTQWVNQKKT